MKASSTNYWMVFSTVVVLLVGVLASAAMAQEEALQVKQKEIENIPIVPDGIVTQTWDWFKSLLGFEVSDPEIVKRSILEQNIQVDGVRLIDEDSYQVFVTGTETFDVPHNEKCYDNDTIYVCEHLWRCDGSPGVEPGCEYRTVSKNAGPTGGMVMTAHANGWGGISRLPSRKEVITTPALVVIPKYTSRLPTVLVDAIKSSLLVEDAAEEGVQE